jgi:BlaI family penicillinase repressor
MLDCTKNFVPLSSYEQTGVSMTGKKTSRPRPTDGELEILRVLWERGASTVRQVHETLEARRPAGYTTALKLLQIMTEKGLVRRDESERAHVYEARVPREETERQLVGDLLEKAFSGSASALVMRALSSKKTSPEELARIRRLLDEMEGGRR